MPEDGLRGSRNGKIRCCLGKCGHDKNPKRPFKNILKYLPPFDDIWKEELYQLFTELKERFPKKEPMLEYMRLIILYSEENRKRKLLNCLKAKEIHYQGKTVKKVIWLF